MKKILATITLVCYLALSCGVVVNFHYCMDKLASLKYYGGESKVCGKCGMHKDPNGCCQDEVKVVKIEDDQQPSPGISDPAPKMIQTEFTLVSFSPTQISLIISGNDHPPPLPATQDIYIQNRVFRI